jgi:predicted RNase H-like HicB family nuclease
MSVGTERQLTAIIECEDKGFPALCPELDVASQGASVEKARQNLTEAVELFLETADAKEITKRLHGELFITQLEVEVG